MWRRLPAVAPPVVPEKTRHDEDSLESLDSLHTSKSMESLDSLTPFKSPVGQPTSATSGGIKSLFRASVKPFSPSKRWLFKSASPTTPHPPSNVTQQQTQPCSPLTPLPTIHNNDTYGDGNTNSTPTAVDSSMTESSEYGAVGSLDHSCLPDIHEGLEFVLSKESSDSTGYAEFLRAMKSENDDFCRAEFISAIKSKNDLISPTFVKKESNLLKNCDEAINSVEDMAPDLIDKEKLGEEIPEQSSDDCRCLWLCPELLLKMLRGPNAQNPSAIIPLPTPLLLNIKPVDTSFVK